MDDDFSICVGATSLNTTPKDWKCNQQNILNAISEARENGVEVLCLPELCITGYGCEDEFHAPYVSDLALDILFNEIAPYAHGIALTVGFPFQFKGAVYNTTAIMVDGKVSALIPKQNLAGDGVHYEPRYFKPWPVGQHTDILIHGQRIPFGDVMISLDGVYIGLEICEDAWVAERPGVNQAKNGVDIILNPSASHFSFDKHQIRKRFVEEGSRAFQCVYVYANLLGNESGRYIYDGDCLIATEGHLLARTKPFSFQQINGIVARVKLTPNRVNRHRQSSFRPENENPMRIIDTHFKKRSVVPTVEPICFINQMERAEQFQKAIALGLFDYLRKSRTKGFAISLSGGADSSACLCLVYFMVQDLLLNYPDHPYLKELGIQSGESVQSAMNKMCYCAYQSSDNSSTKTLTAAQKLAAQTNTLFDEISIQPMVDHLEGNLKNSLGRSLSWENDDITRQNIQARSRAPFIWAAANAFQFLLLTTSNRSEAAVGYCTMDGDTAGSLAPIGGIDKDFLSQWLIWAYQKGIDALKDVIALKPTAELRPENFDQSDESDLMPYPVLNQIQKWAVVQKLSPSAIFHQLVNEHFPTPSDSDYLCAFNWVKKYFRLWSMNQWKRERYAPSFHVDDENLDPRGWCRFPILSGNYVLELEKLEGELQSLMSPN